MKNLILLIAGYSMIWITFGIYTWSVMGKYEGKIQFIQTIIRTFCFINGILFGILAMLIALVKMTGE